MDCVCSWEGGSTAAAGTPGASLHPLLAQQLPVLADRLSPTAAAQWPPTCRAGRHRNAPPLVVLLQRLAARALASVKLCQWVALRDGCIDEARCEQAMPMQRGAFGASNGSSWCKPNGKHLEPPEPALPRCPPSCPAAALLCRRPSHLAAALAEAGRHATHSVAIDLQVLLLESSHRQGDTLKGLVAGLGGERPLCLGNSSGGSSCEQAHAVPAAAP